ncbi:MAG: hypothetical protein LBF60_08335 [Treponema sp.]|nr:hypothetical protein [Treponema sp.]
MAGMAVRESGGLNGFPPVGAAAAGGTLLFRFEFHRLPAHREQDFPDRLAV